MTETYQELVSSNLNETRTNFSEANGRGRPEAWFQASPEGLALFARIVRDLVAPYAKAIGAEGYRFNVDLYAKRFGLTPEQKAIVDQALYPTHGRLKSAVPIMEGRVDLGVKGATTKKGRFRASVADVVWSLQNWSAQSGLIAPGDYSRRAGRLIAQTIADEVAWHVRKAMETGKRSAIGWYDRALKAAKQIYAGMYIGARPGEYGWTPGGVVETQKQRQDLEDELETLKADPDGNAGTGSHRRSDRVGTFWWRGFNRGSKVQSGSNNLFEPAF